MIIITDKTRNTKKLRLAIYKAMIPILDNKECVGFCYAIYLAIADINKLDRFGQNINDKPFLLMISNKLFNFNSTTMKKFPELYKYKPQNNNIFWFSTNKEGKDKRIEILNTIIKEMKNAI